MRELKFRAWQKHHKELFEVGAIQFREPRFVVKLNSIETWTFDEVFLMQFTGLKDRHGQEIYEDDIVMWDGGQYTVIFSERDGSWLLKDDRDDWECPPLYSVSSSAQSRMVIIGNVYEPKDDEETADAISNWKGY